MAFVLTAHKKDLDGISSAALMVRYFTKYRPAPFFLTLKDYPDEAGVIDERVIDWSGYELYIADLATDQKFTDDIIHRLRRVKEKGNKVTWMDHHPTRPEVIEKLSKVVDLLDLRPSTTTSSQIVFDRLYSMNRIEDAHAKLLSDLGHDSDLMEYRFSITSKLDTLIDYYNYLDAESVFRPNLIQLTLHLASPRVEASQGALLERHHLTQITAYEEMRKTERKKVLSSVDTISANGFTFAIFDYPRIFSGIAICNDVLNAYDVSGCIGINEDGSGSIRRKDEGVDCKDIANLLGGGGHKFAAGFSLGFALLTPYDRARAKSMIVEKVHQVYGP